VVQRVVTGHLLNGVGLNLKNAVAQS